MPRLIEYINPHPHTIQLSGPNREVISVKKFSKVVLSDWFIDRYTPKFLRVVRVLIDDPKSSRLMPNQQMKPAPKVLGDQQQKPKARTRTPEKVERVRKFEGVRSGRTADRKARHIASMAGGGRPIVGKSIGRVSELYSKTSQEISIAISNNIGVGILSYNRLQSLQRLIGSIRRHTDLSRTTIFVSDDGSNNDVVEWILSQRDIIPITGANLGVAGNSNRLLNCLSRFKYKILLNDDVEILNSGWDRFYFESIDKIGYHHFCYRQDGLCGAHLSDGTHRNASGYAIKTITDKPHGAVMAFDNIAFDKVGFFDEQLDQYGMEHVDWSNRVGLSGIQPAGFHDIGGSEKFFAIHKEHSAAAERGIHLRENRAIYDRLKNDKARVYVHGTTRSAVPSVGIIIPVRDLNRSNAIQTVINNIRAQRYPCINITVVEQDILQKFGADRASPSKYIFVRSTRSDQEFNKSAAFNIGVVEATDDLMILHDADILVQADYVKRIITILQDYEGCHIGSRVLYFDQSSTSKVCTTGKIDPSYHCDRAVGYFEGGSIAFRKPMFFKIGGFNEDFEGYGCEDCDFFNRLKNNTKFFNQRSIDMLHLWHDRPPGWSQRHQINKKLDETIKKTMRESEYIIKLSDKLKAKYPKANKHEEINYIHNKL